MPNNWVQLSGMGWVSFAAKRCCCRANRRLEKLDTRRVSGCYGPVASEDDAQRHAFVSLNGFGEAWQDIVRQLTESEAQLPILAFGPHADPNLLKKLAWWAVTRSSPTALSLPNYPSASEVNPSMRA